MRKGIIKAMVLFLVFASTVVSLSLLTTRGSVDLTTEMPEATLPVVSFYDGEIQINELYGYTKGMDALTMRDTITPLHEDLVLPLTIRTYQFPIEAISYTVRTMDMERLLEETQVARYSQKDGFIYADLNIQNLLEVGEEYILILTLKGNGNEGQVDYYTRITRPGDVYASESIEFALDFHNKTFDPSSNLSIYLEPSPQADNATLQKVTIHSSLSQVTWANFDGKRLSEPIPSVKEIGSTYNTVVLNYIMTTHGQDGESQYYAVEEYFCVRYSTSNNRMHLLDYVRTMNQIFRSEGNILYENYIQLGIRPLEMELLSNESGTVLSFVQEGELWSYSASSNQLSLVYSFRGVEGMDKRENNPMHDIKIMKVDETGSTDFVVYGYMNRGAQEGECGISVFHYDSIANTIEEELFVVSDKSYQVLKEDWGKLFYVSKEMAFYMIAEDTLYKIDLETRRISNVVTGMAEGSYAVSDDGRYIAWQEGGNTDSCDTLHVMDLEGENAFIIKAKSGEYLKPIGFVKSDFAYGIARAADVVRDVAGNTIFPMKQIIILDRNQEIVKDYSKEGSYVSDAYVIGNTVFLNRVYHNGTGWIPTEQDTIKSHDLEASQVVNIHTTQTEQKQTQMQIVFNEPLPSKRTQVLTPKEILVEEERAVSLNVKKDSGKYYAYSAGKVIRSTKSVAEAIQVAYEHIGAVVGRNQQYIWRRGRTAIQMELNDIILTAEEPHENTIATCLEVMLQVEGINMDIEGRLNQGETPQKILEESLPGCEVLDLSGCSVEQILYYVNQNTPVFAMEDGTNAVLIIGYDEHNTILYDPILNQSYKKGLQDSHAMFDNMGNIFIGYIRN
ncbi:C39 family peptidase [Lachnospiraceae bacterium ZAX-1]